MIRGLRYLRTGNNGGYAVAFYQAAKRSGINMAVSFDRSGEESLIAFLPFDCQAELRRARYEALAAHLRVKPARRQTVIDLLNFFGRFSDDRPFDSIEDVADQFLAAGGRIYILPDGTCEEILPTSEKLLEESWVGYPHAATAPAIRPVALPTASTRSLWAINSWG